MSGFIVCVNKSLTDKWENIDKIFTNTDYMSDSAIVLRTVSRVACCIQLNLGKTNMLT